jgi:adenine phosphoribosyltransferase
MPRTERGQLRRRIARVLRDVPDFPKPGIVFKDITPLLADPILFRDVIASMADSWRGFDITHVAGIESRGFILAAPVALALGAGFIPIRKPGKLPWKTVSLDYALEYGTDRLEIHQDACPPGANVLLIDDVLATGGTAAAACSLIEQAGGAVTGCGFLLSIPGLGGRGRLSGRRIDAQLDAG